MAPHETDPLWRIRWEEHPTPGITARARADAIAKAEDRRAPIRQDMPIRQDIYARRPPGPVRLRRRSLLIRAAAGPTGVVPAITADRNAS